MERAIYEGHVGTPALAPYPSSLSRAIEAIEAKIGAVPQNAANYADLGDIYLFEANWISRAIAAYEQASALAPDEPTYHWRLVDLYMNASRADKMLAQLQYLAEELPADSQTKDLYRYYKKEYDFGDE
jgi:cytochrome c-type biogenesis protein CcmH/NrfG